MDTKKANAGVQTLKASTGRLIFWPLFLGASVGLAMSKTAFSSLLRTTGEVVCTAAVVFSAIWWSDSAKPHRVAMASLGFVALVAFLFLD